MTDTDTTAEAHDWAELRRLAKAASPGPWRKAQNRDGTTNVVGPRDEDYCSRKIALLNKPAEDNADYITAAHPGAVLALLDQRDAMLEALKQHRAMFEQVMDAIGACPETTVLKVRVSSDQRVLAEISVQDCFDKADAAIAKAEGRTT